MTLIKFSQNSDALLEQHPLLQDLPVEAIDTLKQGAVTRRMREGRVLFREAERAGAYLFVAAGEIEILRHTEDGYEHVFQIFEPGQLVAETAMFMAHGRYPMCARARSDAEVTYLRRACLHAACRACPELAMRLLQRLGDRAYARVNEIEWFGTSTAAQRLAAYLLDLRKRVGNGFRLPLTQRQLATHLGIRAETLSRLFARWSERGCVAGARRDWELRDEGFLRDLAQNAHRAF